MVSLKELAENLQKFDSTNREEPHTAPQQCHYMPLHAITCDQARFPTENDSRRIRISGYLGTVQKARELCQDLNDRLHHSDCGLQATEL